MLKAMLASAVTDTSTLKYPLYASPKLDGIRCMLQGGKVLSRTQKPLPNKFLQEKLKGLHGLDGEIMLVNDSGKLVHNLFDGVQSKVMTITGEFQFKYCVFDSFVDVDAAYVYRYSTAQQLVELSKRDNIMFIKHEFITSAAHLEDHMAEIVAQGFEGLILRSLSGKYKQGRSTLNQGWMLKYKYMHDLEAKVIGTEELMRNTDTSTKRNENMVPAGVLGALVLQLPSGATFKAGSGFDTIQRVSLWGKKDELIGKTAVIKYQELSKDGIPRFPVFKSFRVEE